jgi:hypothetical protein
MFGFAHPTIAKLIQEMPGSEKCDKYIMQQFLPASARVRAIDEDLKPRRQNKSKKSSKKKNSYNSEDDSDLEEDDDSSNNDEDDDEQEDSDDDLQMEIVEDDSWSEEEINKKKDVIGTDNHNLEMQPENINNQSTPRNEDIQWLTVPRKISNNISTNSL